MSDCAELHHYAFKNSRCHKALLVNTSAVVMFFSSYPYSFLKDCAVCKFLKPFVTVEKYLKITFNFSCN